MPSIQCSEAKSWSFKALTIFSNPVVATFGHTDVYIEAHSGKYAQVRRKTRQQDNSKERSQERMSEAKGQNFSKVLAEAQLLTLATQGL